MSTVLVEITKQLIEMKVIAKGQGDKALALVQRLQPSPYGQAWKQVAGALRADNLITEHQAETIANNRIEALRQGKYVIFDKLGEGGVGMVYKARHELTGHIVALKMVFASEFVKQPNQEDEKSLQRFLREIEILGQIDSDYVVKVFDGEWNQDKKQFYLAMECIDGVDLHTWVVNKLKNQERLSLSEACRQIHQAAQGLGAAHAEGIVHRDVKPSNLMRTTKGVIKVVDFGMARARGNVTVTQGIVGTAAFMAPEQVQKANVDHRADIYSLGCTFYYLCTGELMYPVDNQMAFMFNHVFEAAPKLKDKRSGVPDWLEEMFQKMVAKSPDQRFSSMLELVQFIEFKTRKPIMPEKGSASNQTSDSQIWIPPTREIYAPKAGDERNNNGLKIPLIWCPPGKFTMGSPENEEDRFENEDQVDVTLTQGFWLGKYPVTQGQWQGVMGTTIQDQAELGTWDNDLYGEGISHPMYYVSWEECQEFCKRYTESERQAGRLPEGLAYELPTEAQWEYACRAGSTTRFCFGDDEAKLSEYAWYDENSERRTHEVGQKQPNAWGLYDMHGNVWEWCRDWYANKLDGGVDPVGPQGSSNRAFRGGGWGCEAWYCRSAYRGRLTPGYRFRYLGFRLALVR